MIRTLKKISSVLIALACGRLVLSMLVGPMTDFPEIHWRLMVPYAFLAPAVCLVRSKRLAGWSVGVSSLLVVVTFITDYEAPRDFWEYLSFWVLYITIAQVVVALLFLYVTVKELFVQRRNGSAIL